MLILGYVEDEWIFNELDYIKSKVHNRLNKNLETCLRIYTSKYALDNFPYDMFLHGIQLQTREEHQGLNVLKMQKIEKWK